MTSTSNSWMVPTLSLETQLSRALARRTAAHLCRDDLSIVADGLIVQAYDQKALIDSLLGRVRQLEVELVLARDQPNPCSLRAMNTSSGPGWCCRGWADHATGPTRCTSQ